MFFENGKQTRDFVNIKDVCQGLLLCLEKNAANYEIFNVGTGIPITIKEVAEIFTEKINPNLTPGYNQLYIIGDIRHCVADISKIKNKLGYEPSITFYESIDELIHWIKSQVGFIQNTSDKAIKELNEKGLLK